MRGKVYLIGAGPGEPGLITLKGIERLKEADVIIYDHLVNKKMLDYAKKDSELIYVGKKRGFHSLPQPEINQLLIKKATEGKKVARLKGGDPFVFGRGGEEVLELSQADIPFEVIPGVTSATAVPAYAGIPLTHRGITSTVTFVTGHEDPQKRESVIPWDKLGAGTLVFLMGMGKLDSIAKHLVKNGWDSNTPVALIRWGTLPEQETLIGTLETISKQARDRNFTPPIIVLVGEVVRLRERLNWFEQKPLFGRRIVITRAREGLGKFANILRSHGASVVEFPTIEIAPPESFEELDSSLRNLKDYQWIVFTSQNGVKGFWERMKIHNLDARELKGVKIAAVGPETAREIEEWGVRVDFLPKEYRTEKIAEGLLEVKGKKILLPRAKGAGKVLSEKLAEKGAKVKVVEAYQIKRREILFEEKEGLCHLLEERKIQVITFTSSSTVNNFVGLFSERKLPQ